jgi:hypothetical protein
MKSLILLLFPVLLGAQPTPEARTQQVFEMWRAGRYDAVYAMFGEQMHKGLSLEKYRQISEQIKSAGQINITGAAQTLKNGQYVVVTIPFDAGSTALGFRLTWDKNDQIAGMFFTPGKSSSAKWEAPAYCDPALFEAHDLTIGDDEWKLPGTLTTPKGEGPFPAVVLVHGSGPNDRDESIEGTKIFKDLAYGLSSRGIAVLRYAKRSKIYPQRFAPTATFTMNEETVDDAVRMAAFLRTRSSIDAGRIFVIGHSQGGYMAPRIGKRDPKLAGLIVLAGNVRPLEDLILEQIEYLASLQGGRAVQQQANLDEWLKRQVQEIKDFKPGQKVPSLLPVPPAYLLDLQGYNPAALAGSLTMPMLILQGERDYQVTMQDFALWKAALGNRPNVSFISYVNLNHLFIAGEGKSTPAEYASGHVQQAVVEDITRWIQSLPRSR